MRLGVYFGWHVHPWEDLLALVRRAEEEGYDAAWVDGDATLHPGRDTLDGWTVTTALLALTRRIAIGSLRIVHHWSTARLAQATATAERITPGRLRFLISIGDRPIDARFGLPELPASERIRWLDETLDALNRVRLRWQRSMLSLVDWSSYAKLGLRPFAWSNPPIQTWCYWIFGCPVWMA